jgi:hypothetical protein
MEELGILTDLLLDNLRLTLNIILMVTIFMTIIDYLELRFKDKINEILTGKPANQYVLSSLLGAVPGCMDAFLVVSLYMHGLGWVRSSGCCYVINRWR